MESLRPEFASFQYLVPGTGRLITPGEYELLLVTAEDLAHLIKLADDDWFEYAAEIRPYSTVLRRLVGSSRDLYRAASLAKWHKPFTVEATILDYQEPHGQVIACAGNWRWGADTIPYTSSIFGGKNVPPPPKDYSYREGVRLPLKKYLNSLSFAITGTKVRRSDVISYVANKKAAHTDDRRDTPAHQALDNVWDSLFFTRVRSDGTAESLNAVYLEITTIIHAIAESPEIRAFADQLARMLSHASRVYDPKMVKFQAVTVPVDKVNRED